MYIGQSVSDGEHVRFQGYLHKIIYAPSAAMAVGSVLFGFFAPKTPSLTCLFLAMAAVSVCVFVYSGLVEISTDNSITCRNLIAESGVVTKTKKQIPLHQIESIAVIQGLLGRLFGYGTVVVDTGGEGVALAFLDNPTRFAQNLEDARALARGN